MIDFSLPPNGARAAVIDHRMRANLADSLAYIGDEIRGLIDHDAAALGQLVAALRRGDRYPPSTFVLYTELVLSLDRGGNDEAAELLALLARERPQAEPWRLHALDDEAIAATAPRYLRLMDSDPDNRFAMLPPPPASAEAFAARFRRAHRLLGIAIPELAAEFDALVSQVILVTGDPHATYQFDGGSSYMLWGGLFLNAESHETDVALIEVMAHESAHILLFGYACDEALVNNDDDALYASPLRVDRRPMDGIYHATYVSARMHWAMSRLIASGVLDDDARHHAEQARAADMKNFEAGYSVVERHGDLTATGAAVMAAARDYMDKAARSTQPQ